jgi:hypothetical protein
MIDIAITPMLAQALRRTWLARPLGLAPRAAARPSSLLVSEAVYEGSRGAKTAARSRLESMRQRVRASGLSASLAGAKTRVTGVVKKALPRLAWVRLRDAARISDVSASWRRLHLHLRTGKSAQFRLPSSEHRNP